MDGLAHRAPAAQLAALEEETRRVADSMAGFLGRPFTEEEASLGLLAFLAWYGRVRSLRESDAAAADGILGSPNDTSGAIATAFAADGLAAVAEPIRVHLPAYRPDLEVRLANEQIRPSHPAWPQWETSLTRAVVLTTRALAFAFVGGGLPAVRALTDERLETLLSLGEIWVGSWLGDGAARKLRLHASTLAMQWHAPTPGAEELAGPPMPPRRAPSDQRTMELLAEVLPGALLQVFGIGHFVQGRWGHGLGIMLSYWLLQTINVGLMCFGVGFVTAPLTYAAYIVLTTRSITSHATDASGPGS